MQSIEGLCFLKESKMNTKLLKNQIDILISFLCAFAPLRDKTVISQKFFSQNEPNSNESGLTATTFGRVTYNDFLSKNPKGNEPKRTQLKPILAPCAAGGFLAFRVRPKQKLKKMKSKANPNLWYCCCCFFAFERLRWSAH